ncbi:MAG: phospho-sugar mutase [Oscillospiraceae bacterium]|nr:phospho-sugar mutase [Oscillospiraceae bacterium]
MNNVDSLYALWLEKTASDEAMQSELRSIEGDGAAILDRFYRGLEFGTAGLRGVLGAGTNRMNSYTVNQATQGLADYLNDEFDNPSVAIAYDSRINSDVFAKGAACVLAANGVRVHMYKELMPTPMLSFAVRRLKCQSGIIITASHNPSQYNGYKCYDPNGYQMTDSAAEKTYAYIQNVDMFDGVKTADFGQALKSGMISYIGGDVIEEFFGHVLSNQINAGICESAGLRVVYTPLNGTGSKPVREILRRIGQTDVTVVPAQENPDGNFPTCPFPNPEIRQAFEQALLIAERLNPKPDLLLATDPDCDRVGIAVLRDDGYRLMSGNEVCVLLTDYILSQRKLKGTLPDSPVVVKSFVTTDMVDTVAKKYGCETKNLLTGFKYTGEFVTGLERLGEENRFILGMEESYGYVAGTHARDKDAVVASMLITEMAAYYKSIGKTVACVMEELYAEHGMYLSTLLNFGFEGASGMKLMDALMTGLRDNAPAEIGGLAVLSVSDYLTGKSVDTITGGETAVGLPKSNVLQYRLPGKSSVIVRPSGTEPKLKIYITSVAKDKTSAEALSEKLGAGIKAIANIK